MKEIVVSVKSVEVRTGKRTWVSLGREPQSGDTVKVGLTGKDDGVPIFVSAFMSPARFNKLRNGEKDEKGAWVDAPLTKLSGVTILVNEDDFVPKTSGKGNDYIILELTDGELLATIKEANPAWAKYNFAFGEVTYAPIEGADRNDGEI